MMLGLLHSTSGIGAVTNMKCAEVYWMAADNYSIICTFCEMKSFGFDDFLMHFKNVHVHKIDAPLSPLQIKEEKDVLETAFSTELNDNRSTVDPVQDTASRQSLPIDTQWKQTDSSDYSKFSDETDESSADEEYSTKILKSSKRSLDNHHKCNECSRSYKRKRNLQYHIKKYHNRENAFKCDTCKRTFDTDTSLELHCKTKHIRFPCDLCHKTYKTRTVLKFHRLTHTEERNFLCDIENCGKAFHTLKALKSHKGQTHKTERNYVCETCGFRTKTQNDLKVHSRSHTGEKPYACEDCDRCFASNSLLKEHKAMHLTIKPHVCDVCGSSFTRPKSLYHHRHLHLGIKKFVCKICGKAYAQGAGLCAHMRQHKADQVS